MKTVFIGSALIAGNIHELHFKKPANFSYIAGQFIELQVPHDNADDRGEKRWFTLSSSPNEDHLAITTRQSDNPSSFKRALFNLTPGKDVIINEPLGDFVLPRNAHKDLLFVAIGIGVTPFRSMCVSLIDAAPRHISMMYADTSQHFAYADILKNTCNLTKTSEKISPNHIIAAAQELNDPLIYISGPEKAVEILYRALREEFTQSQLICDYFHNYT